MRTAQWGLVTAITIWTGGAVEVAVHFDGSDRDWFIIGTLMMVVGVVLAVCAYFAKNRHHLDDAFQAGFTSGLHKGQRIRPKVIRLERDRERTSRQ